MASFYCYIQGLHHTCGRTCEAAPILKNSLGIVHEITNTINVPVLVVPIARNKISGESNLVQIYPHRDTLFKNSDFIAYIFVRTYVLCIVGTAISLRTYLYVHMFCVLFLLYVCFS